MNRGDMVDEIDRAQDQQAANIRQALDNFDRSRRKFIESLAECLDCGQKIPELRRMASPGCQYCVSCQDQIEKPGGGWP